MLMDAGIVELLGKPSLQEALTKGDLELAVATLSLMLELPLNALDLVGLQRLFKSLRETMPVVRFLLRAINASSDEPKVVDDIEDFFDMKAHPAPRGPPGSASPGGSSKLLKRLRG